MTCQLPFSFLFSQFYLPYPCLHILPSYWVSLRNDLPVHRFPLLSWILHSHYLHHLLHLKIVETLHPHLLIHLHTHHPRLLDLRVSWFGLSPLLLHLNHLSNFPILHLHLLHFLLILPHTLQRPYHYLLHRQHLHYPLLPLNHLLHQFHIHLLLLPHLLTTLQFLSGSPHCQLIHSNC